jgi:hypothetical protein
MIENFYQYGGNDRRRAMADAGFARDNSKIWRHPDGRAIGEGVALALTDRAFFQYLGVECPDDRLTSAETEQLMEVGDPLL